MWLWVEILVAEGWDWGPSQIHKDLILIKSHSLEAGEMAPLIKYLLCKHHPHKRASTGSMPHNPSTGGGSRQGWNSSGQPSQNNESRFSERLPQRIRWGWAVVAHTSNPSTSKAEAGELSL